MNLSEIEAALRLDLFDPVGANARWTQADLDRAIDKAVVRYSRYAPNIAYADMYARPGQRVYPYPQAWNVGYPVWWLERIVYPLQIAGSALAAPGNCGSAVAVAGTALNVGVYQYAMTFLTVGGETTPSPASSVTTTSGNRSVALSGLPVGPANVGSANNPVNGRNLYRTLAGGTVWNLLATIGDNTTTSYTDTTTDSVLSGRAQAPAVNTSGIMCWPPRQRAYAESAGFFDDASGLAQGGNMGVQGSSGTGVAPLETLAPGFTLLVSPEELPQDTAQVMRIFYATRHQLDTVSSTIPEQHRDLIVLGATAYVLEAYQVPTNDNFLFQDGTLYDRIDDTNIPRAWLQVAQQKRQQFEDELRVLARQRALLSGTRVHWGERVSGWRRL